jgi:glycine/sarcosine N-methyltransferase
VPEPAGAESARAFYDALAADYDALFDDWWSAARWHASVVDRMLQRNGVGPGARLLDCACGIGTQALGLAALGYEVTGTDVSPKALERARREAMTHHIDAELIVSDMRDLDTVARTAFDAVIACDNALPHLLGVEDLDVAVGAIARVLAPGGVFLASVRDYDTLRVERPSGLPAMTRERAGKREIVGQAWEWSDDGEKIRIHLFVAREDGGGWHTDVHTTWYRALTRAELVDALTRAGFEDVRWHLPDESGYYQPMVTGHAARR